MQTADSVTSPKPLAHPQRPHLVLSTARCLLHRCLHCHPSSPLQNLPQFLETHGPSERSWQFQQYARALEVVSSFSRAARKQVPSVWGSNGWCLVSDLEWGFGFGARYPSFEFWKFCCVFLRFGEQKCHRSSV